MSDLNLLSFSLKHFPCPVTTDPGKNYLYLSNKFPLIIEKPIYISSEPLFSRLNNPNSLSLWAFLSPSSGLTPTGSCFSFTGDPRAQCSLLERFSQGHCREAKSPPST